MNELKTIWMNGHQVPWTEAKVHVLTHALHYGSSFFEGIRCYDTEKGSAVLALDAHLKRLFDSARLYRTDIPFTLDALRQAVIDTIRANEVRACYIRPLVYRGYSELGLNPLPNPVDVMIAVWEWGAYLGGDSLKHGVDVNVSSWRRMGPSSFPAMSKAGGQYMNSQLAKMESLANEYADCIMLDDTGHVSELSGANLFLVKNGKLYTPDASSSILTGITRQLVIDLARMLNVEVDECRVPRGWLHTCDELFLTGTASEVTPIRSVNRIPVGSGEPGRMTRLIQSAFFKITRQGEDPGGWLTYL